MRKHLKDKSIPQMVQYQTFCKSCLEVYGSKFAYVKEQEATTITFSFSRGGSPS